STNGAAGQSISFNRRGKTSSRSATPISRRRCAIASLGRGPCSIRIVARALVGSSCAATPPRYAIAFRLRLQRPILDLRRLECSLNVSAPDRAPALLSAAGLQRFTARDAAAERHPVLRVPGRRLGRSGGSTAVRQLI